MDVYPVARIAPRDMIVFSDGAVLMPYAWVDDVYDEVEQSDPEARAVAICKDGQWVFIELSPLYAMPIH
jgi:hypothetical protein